MKVYVALFYPADTENGGVGGFWWFPTQSAARDEFRHYVKEFGDDSVIRLLDVEVPPLATNSAVTEYLDARIFELEDRPEALDEHRPPGWWPDACPSELVRVRVK